MAGVQWSGGKLTRSQFGAAQRHNEKEERLKSKHSNEDIDKSETERNWSVNGLSYKERMQKLDNRLSEIDTGRKARGKNQRVVAQSLLGYVPPEIEAQGEDALREWVMGFYACVAEQVGEENIIDADVHCDEQHEYVDPDTGEIVMSRIHVHLVFVPAITEEERQIKEQKLDENGEPERDARGKIRYKVVGREKVQLDKPKLNAKQVAARANITRLNTAVDDMTFERFGVHYVTGKGKKGTRSKKVEQLKVESAKAAEKKAAELEKRNAELERELEQAKAEVEHERRVRKLLSGEKYKTTDGKEHLGTKGILGKNAELEDEHAQLDMQVQEKKSELAQLDTQVEEKRKEHAQLDVRVSEKRSELQELTPKVEESHEITRKARAEKDEVEARKKEVEERESKADERDEEQRKEQARIQGEWDAIAVVRRDLEKRDIDLEHEMWAYKDALADLERVPVVVSVDDVVQAVFDEMDERTRPTPSPYNSFMSTPPQGMFARLQGFWQKFTSWLKTETTASGTTIFESMVLRVKERVSPRERARRMPSVQIANTYAQERSKSSDWDYGD